MMVVNNIEGKYTVLICNDPQKKEAMEWDRRFPSVIVCRYVTWKSNHFEFNSQKRYGIGTETANEPIWVLIQKYYKK